MLLAEDNFRFQPQEKIKSSLSIRQVMEGRNAVFAHPLKCFFRLVPNSEPPIVQRQLSVNVSKRRFKHAVDRNRVKRLMREAYRLQKRSFPVFENQTLQMCWMFVGSDLPDFNTMYQCVTEISNKLSNRLK